MEHRYEAWKVGTHVVPADTPFDYRRMRKGSVILHDGTLDIWEVMNARTFNRLYEWIT
jgi:hypothetical protein